MLSYSCHLFLLSIENNPNDQENTRNDKNHPDQLTEPKNHMIIHHSPSHHHAHMSWRKPDHPNDKYKEKNSHQYEE
ncbi:hypothetical protein [Mesobacillus subterraneus]|nr:hypothetical protein [Mesobacillus subterraneus]